MTRKMILLEMLDHMVSFLRRFFAAMQRQIAIVLAIATYENNRKSTGTSLGSWEADFWAAASKQRDNLRQARHQSLQSPSLLPWRMGVRYSGPGCLA